MNDLQNELSVSFETFKDVFLIWVNQGSFQIKIELTQEEGLKFLNWLLEEDEESWPYVGLPLPGSKYIDYFKPENKSLAIQTFGFQSNNFTSFKCFDIEYNARSLEVMSGRLEVTFLHEAMNIWIEAAKNSVEYAKMQN